MCTGSILDVTLELTERSEHSEPAVNNEFTPQSSPAGEGGPGHMRRQREQSWGGSTVLSRIGCCLSTRVTYAKWDDAMVCGGVFAILL